VKIAELARRAGVADTAIRWYERQGVLPRPARAANGYRDYSHADLARLRLVVALRRLGLAPEDAGRMARQCLENGDVDPDLAPLVTQQRAAIARQRRDLDGLEAELLDLELSIAVAGRTHGKRSAAPPVRVLFLGTP
jgi:MerR family mercuric resistance operon transcriptional regulator